MKRAKESTGTPPPTLGVKWYRRLDVRLSVMLVVALLGFQFFSSPVYDFVLSVLGYPVDEEYEFVVTEEHSGEPPEVDAYAKALAGLVISRAQGSGGGATAVDEAVRAMGDLLELQGEAIVVLDADGRITAKTPDLPFELGSAWRFPIRSHTEVTVPDSGEVLAHAIYVPWAGDSDGASTFVLLITDTAPGEEFVCPVTGFTREVDSRGAPARVYLSEAEYEAENARRDRIVSAVWFVAMMGIAILMAAAISRRVTLRLARMSAVASRPLPCGRLPGLFDESGGDEVARMAASMNSMNRRVNQLLDDITLHEKQRREWLAQVSHDLRTPLTALVACLDRAELALQSPRPETLYQEVPDLLAVAKLDIDRVESLVNDLFEIARLEAGDALDLEPVPPGELARHAVRSLEPLAVKKGLKLQVRLPVHLPILSADGRRLMRALENLLRNAIQHAEGYVWIRVLRTDGVVRFEVKDDGPGFPDRTGELSFAELRSRRSREDSAGLGLAVTQKVAEAHGGNVGAHNDAEGGAVVWFALPDPGAPASRSSRT